MRKTKLLQTLDPAPVHGVSLRNVQLLRLDLLNVEAPGNKWFKLQAYVELARESGIKRLVSFGGAWSNHLHALAAVGASQGFATVGIVRGDDDSAPSATLRDCHDLGMSLEFVSRREYRQRYEAEYLASLDDRFPGSIVVPEGGGDDRGVSGCRQIGRLLAAEIDRPGRVVVAAGTGTTLAGIAAELDLSWELIGVSALRGALDLDARVAAAVRAQVGDATTARWRVEHDYHCGGFARVSPALKAFMLEFEAVQGIPLDPVYTAKAMFMVHSLRSAGIWDKDEALTVVHTGGLQGRRGFDWLG